MAGLDRIESELKSLGYNPFYIKTPQGRAVAIDYIIKTGAHKGKKVKLGFSFQEEGYPEYPPHWIHISPPFDDQRGGTTQTYPHPDKDNKEVNLEWRALSRPPQDFWDQLATKHIKHYLDYHIFRFCKELK